MHGNKPPNQRVARATKKTVAEPFAARNPALEHQHLQFVASEMVRILHRGIVSRAEMHVQRKVGIDETQTIRRIDGLARRSQAFPDPKCDRIPTSEIV
jgi:hypothetical protein